MKYKLSFTIAAALLRIAATRVLILLAIVIGVAGVITNLEH